MAFEGAVSAGVTSPKVGGLAVDIPDSPAEPIVPAGLMGSGVQDTAGSKATVNNLKLVAEHMEKRNTFLL